MILPADIQRVICFMMVSIAQHVKWIFIIWSVLGIKNIGLYTKRFQ
jgi:hypothetical protein